MAMTATREGRGEGGRRGRWSAAGAMTRRAGPRGGGEGTTGQGQATGGGDRGRGGKGSRGGKRALRKKKGGDARIHFFKKRIAMLNNPSSSSPAGVEFVKQIYTSVTMPGGLPTQGNKPLQIDYLRSSSSSS